VPASSAALSEHDLEELNAMSPQARAMRLREKAINPYAGAGEEPAGRLGGWTGRIRSTRDLERPTGTAYFRPRRRWTT
jgi:hypothetical protein